MVALHSDAYRSLDTLVSGNIYASGEGERSLLSFLDDMRHITPSAQNLVGRRGVICITNRLLSMTSPSLENIFNLCARYHTELVLIAGPNSDHGELERFCNAFPNLQVTVVPEPPYENRGVIFDDQRGMGIATARNAGLDIARARNWQALMYIDDDIIIDDPSFLRMWQLVDSGYRAAGCNSVEYPDHSVVCHAYNLVGGGLQPFISGSALAIRVDLLKTPPFPYIYNEDWFFIFYHLQRRFPVAWAGSVKQLVYDPFADPKRAISEEAGDLLAEGMARLFIGDRYIINNDAYSVDFWNREKELRYKFICHTFNKVSTATHLLNRADIIQSLQAVLDLYNADSYFPISSRQIVAYLHAQKECKFVSFS